MIICVLEWSAQDLVASWTLVGNKTGATRLGFAVLLKFFEIAARFPSVAGEVPPSAVAYLAEHLHVTADAFLVGVVNHLGCVQVKWATDADAG